MHISTCKSPRYCKETVTLQGDSYTAAFKGESYEKLPSAPLLGCVSPLFGYLGTFTRDGLTNSNAIKNLPGAAVVSTNTVGQVTFTSVVWDTNYPQTPCSSQVFTDDEDCGGDRFCSDVRGACLPLP
ncbi:dickkopf-related protein 1-like isoform X2 [Lates japonicus]|uniref:Dickkopf-related protein 1-like isoform X2 n=1 Tax=Lates japonicus TaxID=270547 RepID=A0AAD3N4G4_LATJO|nr:dickkopf-related protein 1-like isoform X2 [Lates japonicus]